MNSMKQVKKSISKHHGTVSVSFVYKFVNPQLIVCTYSAQHEGPNCFLSAYASNAHDGKLEPIDTLHRKCICVWLTASSVARPVQRIIHINTRAQWKYCKCTHPSARRGMNALSALHMQPLGGARCKRQCENGPNLIMPVSISRNKCDVHGIRCL